MRQKMEKEDKRLKKISLEKKETRKSWVWKSFKKAIVKGKKNIY